MCKKILAIGLCLVVSFTCFGCGSQSATPTQSAGQQDVTKTESQFSTENEAATEEVVVSDSDRLQMAIEQLGEYSEYDVSTEEHNSADGDGNSSDDTTPSNSIKLDNVKKGGSTLLGGIGSSINSSLPDSATNVFRPDGVNEDMSADNIDNTQSVSDSKLAAYSSKSVEFVSYTPQTLTANSRSLILTNLSSNYGTAAIEFTVTYNGKQTYKSEPVLAGNSVSVTASDVVGATNVQSIIDSAKPVTITILSQAYGITVDGDQQIITDTLLNSVVQDVSVSIISDGNDKGESTSYTEQSNDTTYTTQVVYNADNLSFSTVVPAVIEVLSGSKGTAFYTTFKASNAKEGTSVKVTAADSNGDALITLEGSDNTATAELSGISNSKGATIQHTFKKAETATQKAGPIYCTLSNGNTASNDYYGILQLTIDIKNPK